MLRNLFLTADFIGPQGSNSTAQGARTNLMELPERKGNKCQFGARCTNHKCTLEHPTGSSDNTGTRLSPSEEEKKDTVPTLSEMNPMQQQQEHTNPSALGPHHMRLKTKTSESMKRMFQTMTGGGNVHKKALQI